MHVFEHLECGGVECVRDVHVTQCPTCRSNWLLRFYRPRIQSFRRCPGSCLLSFDLKKFNCVVWKLRTPIWKHVMLDSEGTF